MREKYEFVNFLQDKNFLNTNWKLIFIKCLKLWEYFDSKTICSAAFKNVGAL